MRYRAVHGAVLKGGSGDLSGPGLGKLKPTQCDAEVAMVTYTTCSHAVCMRYPIVSI